VLDGDIANARFRNSVSASDCLSASRAGKNLYPTLSVFENIDFFGRLFGQSKEERAARIDDLLASTDLTPFRIVRQGQLPAVMKQKSDFAVH